MLPGRQLCDGFLAMYGIAIAPAEVYELLEVSARHHHCDSAMPKSLNKPRFKVGDRVDVLSTIISRFSGRTGVIIAVEVNQYARSLDEYTVQFEDGSENLFWEFQLKDMGTAA